MRARALVHFLLIGAGLFALQRWISDPGGGPDPELRRISISSERIAELRRQALARWGRLPDRAELEALVDAEIDDEILYREALSLGIGERDALVRRRLVQNMRFLLGGGDGDSGALYREALALGMDRTDLVVRRRLIQRMRMAIETAARRPEPTPEELRRYLERHAERFSEPGRVRLSHLFFSRSRRGAAAEADARALLAKFGSSGAAPAAVPRLGDPFLAPRDLPLQSGRELARLFGGDFAGRVAGLPAGSWAGPIASPYGFHLVWVHQRIPGRILPLASVREEVRYAVLAERGGRAVREAIEAARRRFRVQVEEAAF